MTHAPVPPSDPSGGGTGVPVNRKAIFSLVAGVCGFLLLFVFPFGAVVLGFSALTSGIHAGREIAGSHGEQGGSGLVVYAVMIGGVGLLFGVIALSLSLLS